MQRDDNTLATVLWLTAGGVAGFTAGNWLFGARQAQASGRLPVSSSALVGPALAVASPSSVMPPRALAAGPSGSMQPIDPYTTTAAPAASASSPALVTVAAGPSGSMQPIDPYVPAITVPVITTTTISSTPVSPKAPITPTAPTTPSTTLTAVPTSPLDGPITRPLQLPLTPGVNVSVVPGSSTGPVTQPSQLDATPVHHVMMPASTASSGRFATSARVRRFDPVFERYRGSLPIEYVRALVERESSGRPSVRAGRAIGLMQIVPVVLADYNKRHGTSYQAEHLTDPAINVAIGCELLRLIIASLHKHHPQIPNLRPDWNNSRFVELLTYSWSAGYSEAGGVGRVVRYLENVGALDITIDQVSAHAKRAGASKHLSNPAKVAWSKSVAALYQRERALSRPAQPFAMS